MSYTILIYVCFLFFRFLNYFLERIKKDPDIFEEKDIQTSKYFHLTDIIYKEIKDVPFVEANNVIIERLHEFK